MDWAGSRVLVPDTLRLNNLTRASRYRAMRIIDRLFRITVNQRSDSILRYGGLHARTSIETKPLGAVVDCWRRR